MDQTPKTVPTTGNAALPTDAPPSNSQQQSSIIPGPSLERRGTAPIRPPPKDKPEGSQVARQTVAVAEQSQTKRGGFSLFGKLKDDTEERDSTKKLKAENRALYAQLKEMEFKANKLTAEIERFKSDAEIVDRKINNQLHPDSYYNVALERLSGGITDWTVTHFRGKNTREYTASNVEEIRTGLKKFTDANHLVPETLHWVDVDLQSALTDSKFRIAFVLHVIGLHLHEKVFSPFSYEIEDFGLGYWLKRICDTVSKSDEIDSHFKWNWSKTLFKAIPSIFEGPPVESRILKRLRRILRQVYPRDLPNDLIFDKLQEYLGDAIEIALTMRLEQARFVSTFPVQGATFQPQRQSLGGEEQSGPIRMCTFPGIIKQASFLGSVTPSDISIYPARVQLESSFKHLNLGSLPAE